MKIKALMPFIAVLLAAGPAGAQSSNERIHSLQKRDYSVKNKLEITLAPGASVGDVFTQQVAVNLSLAYHFDEAFALELSWLTTKIPFYDGQKGSDSPVAYKNSSSSFPRWGNYYTDAYTEVKEDASLHPSNADLAMITNYVGLNVQFSPLYGKFTLFNWALGHADFYVSAGGGVAATEFRNTQKLWQDTGTYFVGNFGLGFRIFLARWFAFRIDLRDYAFAARVEDERAGVETKIRNTLFVTLGFSFLFLGEDPVQIWSPY